MTDDQHVPIFYINLQSRPDRRERSEREFSRLGLVAHRIEAHTPASLPADALAALGKAPERKRLSRAELACLASHRAALRSIVDSGARAGVVLEDDVRLAGDFARQIRALAERDDFDIVRLETYAERYRVRKPALPLPDGYRLHRVAQFDGGAGAYLITAEAARRFLARKVDATCPADDWLFNMQRAKPRGLRAMQMVPAVAIQYWHRSPTGPVPMDSDLDRPRLDRCAKYGARAPAKESARPVRELRRIADRLGRGIVRAWLGTPVFYRSEKPFIGFSDDLGTATAAEAGFPVTVRFEPADRT